MHHCVIDVGGVGGFLQGLLGVGSGIVPMAYLSSNFCDIEQHVAVGAWKSTSVLVRADVDSHFNNATVKKPCNFCTLILERVHHCS